MKKFAKIMLIALGFGLLTAALGFLTSNPAPAQLPPPVVPVKVTNTPLPVQGAVNANVTNTVPVNVTNAPLAVQGTVTANINSFSREPEREDRGRSSGTVAVSNNPAQ